MTVVKTPLRQKWFTCFLFIYLLTYRCTIWTPSPLVFYGNSLYINLVLKGQLHVILLYGGVNCNSQGQWHNSMNWICLTHWKSYIQSLECLVSWSWISRLFVEYLSQNKSFFWTIHFLRLIHGSNKCDCRSNPPYSSVLCWLKIYELSSLNTHRKWSLNIFR